MGGREKRNYATSVDQGLKYEKNKLRNLIK